jgi:hypothetical protein
MRIQSAFCIAPVCFALIFCSIRAHGGPVPMPLETELDMAKTVFVGKIIDLTREQEERVSQETWIWGRAVFRASELLKGAKEEQVMATVLMGYRYTGGPPGPATIYRTYRKGDEGIWVVMWSGRVSHSYGLLEKDRLNEIKADLDALNKRTWSEAVGGLKVSALKGSYYGDGVFFTVKNVAATPIYLPSENYRGFVSAVARNRTEKEFVLMQNWNLGQSEPKLPLISEVLQPGEVRYLGLYIIPKDLPPETYSIVVTLANTIAVGKLQGKDQKEVKLWTGQVASPKLQNKI